MRIVTLVVFVWLLPTLTSAHEVTFYDINDEAAAFVETDTMSVYLWSGEPVAYVVGESLYGFNGKHLGWFTESMIWNNEGYPLGYMEGAVNRAAKAPVQPKGVPASLPEKAAREAKAPAVTLRVEWGKQLLLPFLQQGRVVSSSR